MALSRNLKSTINLILDRFLPPILREQRWFYRFILRRMVKSKSDVEAYLDFRQNCWRMNASELQDFYRSIPPIVDRPTDCNDRTIDRILTYVERHHPKRVLEFGCGRGHLTERLIQRFAIDYPVLISIPRRRANYSLIKRA